MQSNIHTKMDGFFVTIKKKVTEDGTREIMMQASKQFK